MAKRRRQRHNNNHGTKSSENHYYSWFSKELLIFLNVVVLFGGVYVNLDLDLHQYVSSMMTIDNEILPVNESTTHKSKEPIPILELVSSSPDYYYYSTSTKTTNTTAGNYNSTTINITTRKINNNLCPGGLMYMADRHLSPNITHGGRKIPRILHVTGKSRCVPEKIYYNVKRWTVRLKNHSFYFHDDRAVDRLLQRDAWTDAFPRLRDALLCVTSGATKADLWRYLVLWEYGGLYADIDSAPRKFDSDTIRHFEDDAFFVVDGETGGPSQWFMASSRRHPLMRLALDGACRALIETNTNVFDNKPFETTGPRALDAGFRRFMDAAGRSMDGYYEEDRLRGTWGYYQNRSVRIVGTRENGREYVAAEEIEVHKHFLAMNMTHHSIKTPRHARDDLGRVVSCKIHIENVHNQQNNATANPTTNNNNNNETITTIPPLSTKPQDMYRTVYTWEETTTAAENKNWDDLLEKKQHDENNPNIGAVIRDKDDDTMKNNNDFALFGARTTNN